MNGLIDLVFIVLLCLATSFAVITGMFSIMMIGEVNRRREDQSQISYFWVTPWKMLEVFGEYRRLYPRGRLHIYALVAYAFCMGVFAVLALLFAVAGL